MSLLEEEETRALSPPHEDQGEGAICQSASRLSVRAANTWPSNVQHPDCYRHLSRELPSTFLLDQLSIFGCELSNCWVVGQEQGQVL